MQRLGFRCYSLNDSGILGEKKIPRALDGSRTYDLPSGTSHVLPLRYRRPFSYSAVVERHKACGRLGRLNMSMLTNFLLTARIEMSNVMLLRDDVVDEDGKCET